MIPDYDPNKATNMTTVHVYEITFQMWDYYHTVTTEVGGNCRGFRNFEAAISNVYDTLPISRQGVTEMTLTNKAGDQLTAQDEEDLGEDFLQDMVVSIELKELKNKNTHP